MAASTSAVKSMLGRALRETGAAMKEYGRAEVNLHLLSMVLLFVFLLYEEQICPLTCLFLLKL
jgi:hypothetical protein